MSNMEYIEELLFIMQNWNYGTQEKFFPISQMIVDVDKY